MAIKNEYLKGVYEGLAARNPEQKEFLQAVEEGLGAGWMGIGPGTPDQAALAELLGLPETVKPYSIVGIGYPAEDADLEATDRFDAARIHYNKY